VQAQSRAAPHRRPCSTLTLKPAFFPSNAARRRRPSLWLVGAWLAALLAMQALGLVHGVAHAGALSDGAPVHATAMAQSGDGLFGLHDAGSLDCQFYDQLAHGGLATPPVIAWGMPPQVSGAMAWVLNTPRWRSERRYSARDPPASSLA
jgi:hypothetical protein